VTLRERLSNTIKSQGKKRKRWNIDKLKNEEYLNPYPANVENMVSY
jgi:hypothetical protein